MKKHFYSQKPVVLFLLLFIMLLTAGSCVSAAQTITRFGTKKFTVTKGTDFELKVLKTNQVNDQDLKWSIKNKSIVAFENPADESDGDDEQDFVALKAGTTTITCQNTATNEKVTFTIQVKSR
ncbi:MAG: hypothetical protein ACI4EI_08575 [Muricoprocola sp.]